MKKENDFYPLTQFIKYLLLAIISLWGTVIFSFFIEGQVGGGPDGIGVLIGALALINATLITGFTVLHNEIKKIVGEKGP